jgi:hypothetical protein
MSRKLGHCVQQPGASIMSIQPWQVVTWPLVLVNEKRFNALQRSMQALGVSQYPDPEAHLNYGQVLWGVGADDDRIGIAWDWAEVKAGVPAMIDPMTLATNAVLVTNDGQRLDDGQQLLKLHAAINRLNWQEVVRRRLVRPQKLPARTAAPACGFAVSRLAA